MIYWLKSWKKQKYHFSVPKKWFYSFACFTKVVGTVKIQLLTSFEQKRWKTKENLAILVFIINRKAALVNQSIKISKNASHFILSTLKKEHFMWSGQADQSNFSILPNQTWVFSL
jgi:hypothetical protein